MYCYNHDPVPRLVRKLPQWLGAYKIKVLHTMSYGAWSYSNGRYKSSRSLLSSKECMALGEALAANSVLTELSLS